jgi:hypothetical protein
MGKIVSPAGEFSFAMKSLQRKGDDVVIIGTMGVWESEISLSYQEVFHFLFNPSVLIIAIMLPILPLKKLFRRKN